MNMKKFVASAVMVGIGATGVGTAFAQGDTDEKSDLKMGDSQSVVFLAENGESGIDLVHFAHLDKAEEKEILDGLKDNFGIKKDKDGVVSESFIDSFGSGIELAPDVYADWADELKDEREYSKQAKDFAKHIENEDYLKAKEEYTSIMDDLLNQDEDTVSDSVIVSVMDIEKDKFKGQALTLKIDDSMVSSDEVKEKIEKGEEPQHVKLKRPIEDSYYDVEGDVVSSKKLKDKEDEDSKNFGDVVIK